MSLLIYIIPAIIALFAPLGFNKQVSIFLIFYIFLILFFRDGVGYDYYNYIRITEDQVTFNFSPFGDILNKIAFSIGITNGFLGLAALIQSIILLVVVFRDTENRFSLLVYIILPFFFIDSFTTVRQALAISFLILGYQFFEERRYYFSYILGAVATLIHPSAIMAFPLYLYASKKLSTSTWVVLGCFIFIGSKIGSDILGSGLLSVYRELDQTGYFYILLSLYLLVISLVYGRLEYVKICLVGFVVSLLINEYLSYVFYRFLPYFYLPLLFGKIGDRNVFNRMVRNLLFFILFVIVLYVKVRDPNYGFIPYQTVF